MDPSAPAATPHHEPAVTRNTMTSGATNLQRWCAIQCKDYPGVHITDLCSSFRDGLAFCAIINRYRPDLLHFETLQEDNIYANCRLAFEVAERELGIPALLDANDMESMKKPDRLSIITYLSQYYNYFHNKRPVVEKPNFRHKVSQFEETSPEEPEYVDTFSEEDVKDAFSLSGVALKSTCAFCRTHVHLVQRYLADGKLYHRQCFRCKESSKTLPPGQYLAGLKAGTLMYTAKLRPLRVTSSPEPDEKNSVQNKAQSPPKLHVSPKPPLPLKPHKDVDAMPESRPTPAPVPAPRRTSDIVPQPIPRARAAAEQRPVQPTGLINDEQMPTLPVPKPRGRQASSEREEEEKQHKDPPWISLVPAVEPKKRAAPPPPCMLQSQDDDEKSHVLTEDTGSQSPSKSKHYNPFEDEAEEKENSLKPEHPWYGITPTSSPKTQKRPAPKAPNASPLARHSGLLASRLSHSEPPSGSPSPALSTESLHTDTSSRVCESKVVLKSSSEPTIHSPTTPEPSEDQIIDFVSNSPEDSIDPNSSSTNTTRSSSSELSSAGEAQETPPPKERESPCNNLRTSPSRPAPKPPGSDIASPLPEIKQPTKTSCKENPFNRKSSAITSSINRKSNSVPKPARPPAPGHGFPLIKRKVQADDYIPEDRIQTQLEEIQLRLDELERCGVELEHKLRGMEDCNNTGIEEDNVLVEWFMLIQEKHKLVRRESELMYTTRQQSLEQRQADVEYELRCLLNKPAKEWTEEDRKREPDLLDLILLFIEERNAIVISLDEDRLREVEEDRVMQAALKNRFFPREPRKKKKGKFKNMNVLKLLSPKQDSKSKSPKDKNREQEDGAKR